MNPLLDGLARHLPPAARARLAGARVGVAGAGGLGSNAAVLLARSGVGAFTLVDFDRVEASNLNRQTFWPEDVGRFKAEALADRLRALNPALDLRVRVERVTAANAAALFGLPAGGGEGGRGGAPRCDAVVEAFDGAADKAMLFDRVAGGAAAPFYVTASGVAGWGGAPIAARRLGARAVAVGDFTRAAGPGRPPMGPRVAMAAAAQADAVLAYLLDGV